MSDGGEVRVARDAGLNSPQVRGWMTRRGATGQEPESNE